MLLDIVDGPAAEELCRKAETGSRTAISTVTANGVLPADRRRTPAFLFLTRQWERYDAVDPNGRRLRAYAARLGSHDPVRTRLVEAAAAGRRPAPCEPALPYWATTRPHGSGRAYGVSGSGGYSDAGGGFSVHGV
jgi:hypothetical protein